MPPKRKPRDRSPEKKPAEPQFYYYVSKGHDYEGAEPQGSFVSLEEARLCAKDLMDHYPKITRNSKPGEFIEVDDGDSWRHEDCYIEIHKVRIWSTFAAYRADIAAQITETRAMMKEAKQKVYESK